MKVKTAELTGSALDWAVAQCENTGRVIRLGFGYEIVVDRCADLGGGEEVYSPSTNWEQGGPIIEREGIWLRRLGATWEGISGWFPDNVTQAGPTPLIAAMRCFIASRLGDEVDIPDELL